MNQLTLHVDALFLSKRDAKLLHFSGKPALDVLCCEGLMSRLRRREGMVLGRPYLLYQRMTPPEVLGI